MPRRSAGIVLYRLAGPTPGAEAGGTGIGPAVASLDGVARLEVLLVHPGGPYWSRRDEGWWSIPKGEPDVGEAPLAAAEREVHEELGFRLPSGKRLALGEVVQAGGKRVEAWAVEADVDPSTVTSGTFEMEWPPRSGVRRTFPEIDRAAWYDLDDARRKILPGQRPLLDRLATALASAATRPQPASLLAQRAPSRNVRAREVQCDVTDTSPPNS